MENRRTIILVPDERYRYGTDLDNNNWNTFVCMGYQATCTHCGALIVRGWERAGSDDILCSSHVLQINTQGLSKDTVFPSVRALLEAEVSCRETPAGTRGGWAFYFMESGAELTYFSGMEGGYECNDVNEALECIGGDQECYLTPASLRRFGVGVEDARRGRGKRG